MSAISQVKICNMALTKLGAKRITALDDGTEEGRLCAAVYDEMLEDVLCEHPWSFATKRVALALVDATPAFDFSLIYQVPVDSLRIWSTNLPGYRYRIEGDKVLSSDAELKVIYTYRNENPALYFPKFSVALASRLAVWISFPLLASNTTKKELKDDYQLDLIKAIRSDSQQGTPFTPLNNELINARDQGPFSGEDSTDSSWFSI